MPIPSINTTQSILGFRQYESFSFQASATDSPLRWTASALPPGVTMETHVSLAATGVASIDVVTATGNAYADLMPVYFESLAGGTGLVINTIYFVRDRATDTFKLAATPGGAAINFTTDISAAQIRRVSAGVLSGASTAAGVFVASLRAINADGTSAAQVFTLGFDAAAGSPDDDALDLYIDTASGAVSLFDTISGGITPPTQSDAPLISLKVRDRKLVRVHFRKSGNIVNLTLTALRITAKEFPDDAPSQAVVLNNAFEKPAGTTYFEILMDLGNPAMLAAISSVPAAYVATLDIEWRRDITILAATEEIVNTSKSIPVEFVIDNDGI